MLSGVNIGANRGLNNSRYPAKAKFNNYFTIHIWNYLSFILCTNYSLELFSFILCAKTKKQIC